MGKRSRIAMLATAALCWSVPAAANEAQLKAEIAALKAQLALQAEQLARLEAATQALTQSQATTTARIDAIPPAPAAQPAAMPVETAAVQQPATTIGGYGEAIFNGYLRNGNGSRNKADFRRFVLFFGHRFSDRLSLNSELEVEHAITSGGGDPGEVALEQAYLAYQFDPSLNVKGGLFLLPFGFLNRSHEPPAFFGVERNEIETRIIPTTLREGGIGIFGTTNSGFSYDAGITTSYSIANFGDPAKPLRSLRQGLAEARAANFSLYAGLEYKGIPGLTVGGAISSGNSSQKNATFKSDPNAPDLSGIKARITLWDVHARYQFSGFDVKGLYARGTIAGAGQISQAIAAVTPPGKTAPVVPSAFDGWFVEGAYNIGLGGQTRLAPFARYERYDTQAKLAPGLVRNPATKDEVITAGFSFFPLDDVVIKADYQNFKTNSKNDRINIGIGYQF